MAKMSGNPVFRKMDSFAKSTEAVSLGSLFLKTLFFLSIVVISAGYSYQLPEISPAIIIGSLIGGLGLGFFTIFNPPVAIITGPLYCLCQGILLGMISRVIDLKYPGTSMQALMGTGAVFLTMLTLYSQRVILVNEKFIKGIIAAMMGILFIYLADIIFSLMGMPLPVINDSSIWGILFSCAVVIVAALSLTIDFWEIEQAVDSRQPKQMEFFLAFGLMVSLIWLYLEILDLIRKLKD